MSNKTYEKHKFKELLNHVGHHIECVTYGNKETGVVNIAIECQTCHEILFNIDKPKTIEKYVAIPKKYPEEVAIRYNIDDVMTALRTHNIEVTPRLTEQEAAKILNTAIEEWDEETPITLNTFVKYAEELYPDRLTKKETQPDETRKKYNFQWSMTESKYKILKAYHDHPNPNMVTLSTDDIFGAVYCNQLCVEFFHTCDKYAWYAYSCGFEYTQQSHPRYSPKSEECEELNNVLNVEQLLGKTKTFEEFKEKVEKALTEAFEKDEELEYKATTEVPEEDKDVFFIKLEETLELPDGKKIICPAEINMSELTDFDDLEYELWHTIESYLDRMGIKREDDDPDWATVKEVQTTILNILERSGVNIKL